MRGAKSAFLAVSAAWVLLGCEAQDKVLTPDPIEETDASVDPSTGGDTEPATDGEDSSPDGTPDDEANDGVDMSNDETPGDDTNDDGTSDSDGADADGTDGPVAADPDCDMNGIWIGRMITVSTAPLVGDQFASNWYYFEIEHNGQDFVVTNHYDCGIKVLGTVTVQLSKATLEALTEHNVQIGRKGKLYKEGNTCHFEMERFWSVRGANEDTYVPKPRNTNETIAQVKARIPIPSKDNTQGAEDWEKDGQLGSAWQVSGIVSGTRNTVQRDWTQYFSDATHPMTPAKDWPNEIKVRANFDSEENILDPPMGLLASGSTAKGGAQHNLTLKFLGRTADDARAKQIIKANRADTCFAVQAALPARQSL